MNKNQLIISFKNLFKINLENFSLFILLILTAFIFGNFFGLYSKSTPNIFYFILIANFLLEIISFWHYSQYLNLILLQNFKSPYNFFFKILNSIKRGFLIGIFVEAFKVGS
jgi:Protein of unknown function (DUF565)